jgi:hypothetical protein
MVRYWKLVVLTLLFLLIPSVVQAAAVFNPAADLFSADPGAGYVCPANVTQRYPGRCPAYSPGARQTRIEYLRATLPNPLPQLAVEPLEVPEDAITPFTFAYIRPLPAASYRHPEEALAGLPPLREFLAGDNWVSVLGEVEYNGQRWYEINEGEFVLADHIAITNPSRFRGVLLTEQPHYPFGWINRDVNPSKVPGGAPRTGIVFRRYELITIFAQELLGETMWYMIGEEQWVDQSFTSRVDVDPIPEGVGSDENGSR